MNLQWTLRDLVHAWIKYGDPHDIQDLEVFKTCLLGTHFYNQAYRNQKQSQAWTPQALRRLVEQRIKAIADDSLTTCTSWQNCLDGLSLNELKLHGL